MSSKEWNLDRPNDPAAAERRRRYFELVSRRPDAFRNPAGEGVEILLESQALAAAEGEIAERLRAEGSDISWGEVGLFYEDPWIWVVRDVTRFPDGGAHAYHRVILKGGARGVVTVPVLDGELVLIEHFRHGLRAWSLEFPRGGPDEGKSSEELARLELEEEIGAVTSHLEHAGCYASNSGIMTAMMDVYVAHLESLGRPNLSEGIRSSIRVSSEGLEDLIRTGGVVDANTITAFQIARVRSLI